VADIAMAVDPAVDSNRRIDVAVGAGPVQAADVQVTIRTAFEVTVGTAVEVTILTAVDGRINAGVLVRRSAVAAVPDVEQIVYSLRFAV
jgi:hypothetical protein